MFGSYPALCQGIVFETGASKFLVQHKGPIPQAPQTTVVDWIRPPGVVLGGGGIHPPPPQHLRLHLHLAMPMNASH